MAGFGAPPPAFGQQPGAFGAPAAGGFGTEGLGIDAFLPVPIPTLTAYTSLQVPPGGFGLPATPPLPINPALQGTNGTTYVRSMQCRICTSVCVCVCVCVFVCVCVCVLSPTTIEPPHTHTHTHARTRIRIRKCRRCTTAQVHVRTS
jgi:hypothetical protein